MAGRAIVMREDLDCIDIKDPVCRLSPIYRTWSSFVAAFGFYTDCEPSRRGITPDLIG